MTRGQKIIAFIEAFVRIPEGSKVGEPMKLMKFQKKFILDVYDNPQGTSRAYLSVARKNGKSALIAGLVLAHVVGPEAKQNSQIISGARSRDQASLVFKLAEKMVRLSPELSKIVRIVPSQKSLIGLICNVEYKAISADSSTAHGMSPILAIIDEAGQVRGPTDAFIEAVETAQGAHENPLLIAISTQAATDGDMFSIWLDDAENAKDPRIVSHLYTAPKDCRVLDKKAWKKANPAMGEFRSAQDIADFAAQAHRLPAKANSFRWLYLNQRIEAHAPFLTRAEWEACNAKPNIEDGDVCYAGLDLSASRDLTALVLVFPKGDEIHVQPHFWLPSDGLYEKAQAEKVPWDLWRDQGYLKTIDGPVINPAVIAEFVAELSQVYELHLLAFDRWRINDFTRELDNIGAQINMQPFGQGFKDMSPAIDKLERAVVDKKILHGDHPILNMNASGAVTQQDPAGNRKLHKAKSYSKIDGLVALSMALGAINNDHLVTQTSPWDDPNYKLAV
tara:strand:+ start:1712 stop:3226 length:1515 start_codon:yes stop_codon:yes gene_type:complete